MSPLTLYKELDIVKDELNFFQKTLVNLGITSTFLLIPYSSFKNILISKGFDETLLYTLGLLMGVLVVLAIFIIIIGYIKKDSENIAQVVHVLLPLTGHAKGDGLLMAAGFDVANKDFANVKIQYYDHKADPNIAINRLRDIVSNYSRENQDSIWVISTMSEISVALHEASIEILKNNPKLRKRFTLLSTVAAAPSCRHDPENNFFRYSVDGKQEAEKIFQTLLGDVPEDSKEPVILVPMMSNYPLESIAELSRKLIVSGRTVLTLLVQEDGSFKIPDTIQHDFHVLGATKAVVFAYDTILFEALRNLISSGFKGKIYNPTTLSVKDWQQYLENDAILKSNHIEYHYLQFEHSENSAHDVFKKAIGKISFENITNSTEIYGQLAGDIIRNQFEQQEIDAYNEIDANYISELCHESVRILDAVIAQKKKRLVSIECVKNAFEKLPGPLRGISELPSGAGFRPGAELVSKKL